MTVSSSPLRIIIHAIGSAGDVHPFIGIGRAMKRRGHEVYLTTNPFYQEQVEAAGLGFRPLGTTEDFHRIQNNPDLWHPRRALPAIIRHAVDPSHAPIMEITRELNDPGRTVLVASSLAFGARNVRDLLDIPMASVHLAPSLFQTIHRQPEIHGMPFGDRAPKFLKRFQWAIAGKILDHHALPTLNRFRGAHGLAPAKNLLADWWHSPDRTIALFPSWFAPAQPDWPTRTVQTGFPLFDETHSRPVTPELERYLSEGDPPVIFTPGSAMAHGQAFFRESLEAVNILGCRALFLTSFKETVPSDLPSGVMHFSYLPFSQILPRSAALVYHGGIGTCAQALQAGVPHLIQPMAHDQLDTLSRVRDLGVGLGIQPARFKGKRIANVLHTLMEDRGFRTRAAEVSAKFQPTRWMDSTCEQIETLIHPKTGPIP